MYIRILFVMALVWHCGVCVSQAAGVGITPGSGGGTVAHGCDYREVGQLFDACYLAPTVCENGPFTSKAVCHASVQHRGCRGRAVPRVVLVTPGHGDALDFRACGEMTHYKVLHCRCSGDLFGWCLGPCVPTAGLAAIVPCPGTIAVLKRCPGT